jgi:1-acyl-sn-glycerol-3-phosphate acyltransferase
MAIGEIWIDINSHIFAAVNDTRWEIEGVDDLKRDSWYLVMSNHQTWVDIVALQTALNRRVPFLKFFIKQELIWFPFLGLAWWAMDMPFMKRYSKSYLAKHPEKKGMDLEITRQACQKFRDTPTSIINFIEGTRFSEAKKVYPGEPPNFWNLFCGEFEHVVIHVEQKPVEDWMVTGDYSNDREYRRQFHQWLTTLWQEKDEHIVRVKAEIDSSAQARQRS